MNDSLGDRMKMYERASSITLTPKVPVIIRVDGRSMHTVLKNAGKPFDVVFTTSMSFTTTKVAQEIQNCIFSYVQSDEASFLLWDTANFDTQPWFGNKLQKLVSMTASIFTFEYNALGTGKVYPATFDARAFSLPVEEVANYFIWRNKDAMRNSVSMLAQSMFPHALLQGKSSAEMRTMTFDKGKAWEFQNPVNKYGHFWSNMWPELVGSYDFMEKRDAFEQCLKTLNSNLR